MRTNVQIDKEDLESISDMISAIDSKMQRMGIIIGYQNGLRPIEMAKLFLNNNNSWKLYKDQFGYFNYKKKLISNQFDIRFNFESMDFFFNEWQLLWDKKMPININNPSCGYIIKLVLRLINREIKRYNNSLL